MVEITTLRASYYPEQIYRRLLSNISGGCLKITETGVGEVRVNYSRTIAVDLNAEQWERLDCV